MSKRRFVNPEGGLKLEEEEFIGAMAYFSDLPIERVRTLWQAGATFGSLVLGKASIKDVYEE